MLFSRQAAFRSPFKLLSTSMPLRAKINPSMLPALSVMETRSQSTSSTEDDVLFSSKGSVQIIELNRPSKLNSLDQSMCDKIIPRLTEWTKSDTTHTIILKGAGGKALCAGGDVAALVRGIVQKGDAGSTEATSYFKDEYTLNQLIATYPKPYVALMHGITMGGGAGLSVHAPFRVATEKTMFAMPETDIGFFPDVGGMFFLSRLDGHIGTYLALTSARLRGYDVVSAGLATHYVPSDLLPQLEARLVEATAEDKAVPTDRFNLVNSILNEFAVDAPEGYVNSLSGERRNLIDRAFGKPTAEEIVSELEKEGSEFALKTKDTIIARSPTSVKATLHALNKGKTIGITDVLNMEYRLAEHFMYHPDFVEGVSAKLLTKPAREPSWSPPTISEVSTSAIQDMFSTKADSVATDIDFVYPDINFHQYPHSFGLPSEVDVCNYVTGNDNSDREFKVSRQEVLDNFQLLTKGKVGVSRKVGEILDRKTRPDPTDATLLDWIYE